MDRHVQVGMRFEIGPYMATATLARRSGGREQDEQPVLSPLRIELHDKRLEPRTQVYRVRRCVDSSARARKKAYCKACRKPEHSNHTHLL